MTYEKFFNVTPQQVKKEVKQIKKEKAQPIYDDYGKPVKKTVDNSPNQRL